MSCSTADCYERAKCGELTYRELSYMQMLLFLLIGTFLNFNLSNHVLNCHTLIGFKFTCSIKSEIRIQARGTPLMGLHVIHASRHHLPIDAHFQFPSIYMLPTFLGYRIHSHHFLLDWEIISLSAFAP